LTCGGLNSHIRMASLSSRHGSSRCLKSMRRNLARRFCVDKK
jgi:hypothetical protein